MPVPTKVPKWSLLVSQPPGLGHVSICDSELVTRGVQPIVCAWGTGPETRGTCLRQQGKIEYICTYIYISSDTFDFEVAESPVLLQSGALCSHHLVFPNGNDCQNDVTGSQAGSRRRGPSRGRGGGGRRGPRRPVAWPQVRIARVCEHSAAQRGRPHRCGHRGPARWEWGGGRHGRSLRSSPTGEAFAPSPERAEAYRSPPQLARWRARGACALRRPAARAEGGRRLCSAGRACSQRRACSVTGGEAGVFSPIPTRSLEMVFQHRTAKHDTTTRHNNATQPPD